MALLAIDPNDINSIGEMEADLIRTKDKSIMFGYVPGIFQGSERYVLQGFDIGLEPSGAYIIFNLNDDNGSTKRFDIRKIQSAEYKTLDSREGTKYWVETADGVKYGFILFEK